MKPDAEVLFKTFQHLSNEFYKNEDNRWKYFTAISGLLSVLVVALQLFPQAQSLILIALLLISSGGLVVLVYIYRIIIAIDNIVTQMYEELLRAIVDPDSVKKLKYPKSAQFLRGYEYFFTIHNALASVFAGFFAMAAMMLVSLFVRSPAWSYAVGGIVLWAALLLAVWRASNLGLKY